MSRLAIWLLSLLALLVLCVVCVQLHAGAIEAELREDTLQALSTTELRDAAEITFDGRDAIIRTDDPEIGARLIEVVRGVPGVRTARVVGPLPSLPEVTLDGPFALMPLENGGLALRGTVPDSATRDRLMASALMAFPGRMVRDGLVVDSAASGGWSDDVAATFSRLKAVENPGLAVDSSGMLVLSGTVDGEGARRNVESRITEVVTPREIDNRLALAGAPEGPTPATDTLGASGETPAPTDANTEADTTSSIPSDTSEASSGAGTVEVQNALPGDDDAVALERALRQRLGQGTVTFQSGTDRLTPGSEAVLQRAAEALKAHPEIAIELQAHTDNQGPRAANQRLSEARARAAKRVLAASGVERRQLLAAGYGESTPIADNDTEAGRDANRRVVFKLLRRR